MGATNGPIHRPRAHSQEWDDDGRQQRGLRRSRGCIVVKVVILVAATVLGRRLRERGEEGGQIDHLCRLDDRLDVPSVITLTVTTWPER